ncbi:Metallo-dependent phosphatase [Rhizodiscina lignyota]|uniref:Metallo-dependent phosphatase n=1 Tax=Rhizodiscina lignyota TaxID=1504668 RepID=A0A9P4IQ88_9PEZI|nr:Metallo-dependent phosphatase [Rhizodiscina lignyota]
MKVKTRFLILSDTHDEYDELQSLPKADVLLHCGDLTQTGSLSSYQRVIDMMKQVPAELKLIIAGDQDISLDAEWWKRNLIEDEDDPEESRKALGLFTDKSALGAGIRYLEEGIHKFVLSTGATFTLYASSYTPESDGYAFTYAHNEDRFNRPPTLSPGVQSFATNPIPKGVDIVMTHGPPRIEDGSYTLDLNRESEACGCPYLFRAIKRVKPLLHCFGHVHEGRGIQKINWDLPEQTVETITPSLFVNKGNNLLGVGTTSSTATPFKPDYQTLLVNAAML